MKNILSLLSSLVLLTATLAGAAEPAKDLTGSWQGTLIAGAMKLRVVFNISQSASGGLTATMDSLDQNARGIPVDRVTLTGQTLNIEVKVVRGTYQGTVDAAGKAVTGQWTQGPGTLPLDLVKGALAAPAVVAPADLAANQEAAQKLAGTWNGALNAGSALLHLRVNLTKTATGAATGTMDSLDQGANGLPLSAITLKAGKLRFEVPGVGGTYEATLAADGATLTGHWQQNGQTLPLDLQKAKAE